MPPPAGARAAAATGAALLGVYVFRRVGQAPLLLSTVLVGAGLALAPSNALRISTGVTVSDTLLAAAALTSVVGVLALRDRTFPIPWWLSVGAAMLLISILVAEAFHPMTTAGSTLLYRASLGVGVAAQDEATNLDMGARLLVALVALPIIVALPG